MNFGDETHDPSGALGLRPEDDPVAWAKAYPFGHPDRSYLFEKLASGAIRVAPLDGDPELFKARMPVLASGSNAAPRQLARKYARFRGSVRIPVTRARIHDFDSVYATHLASYGSLPATLFPSPGTVLSSFITWLDPQELVLMHATEQPGVHYHFAELSGIRVDVERLGSHDPGSHDPAHPDRFAVLDRAYAYVAVAGAFGTEGPNGRQPVSLEAVPAQSRRFRASSQAEMLDHLRAAMAPSLSLDAFIHALIRDSALRENCRLSLEATACAFRHPGCVIRPATADPGPGSDSSF